MNRLLACWLLLIGCSPAGYQAAGLEPAPPPRSQHELQMSEIDRRLRDANESGDDVGAAHWERLRAWEVHQQAAVVDATERAAWANGKAITPRDTPAGIVGMLVRLDGTVDRVDDAMAYFDFQTSSVVCRRETVMPRHSRWGRRRSGGGGRWRSSGSHRRSGWWRHRRGTGTAPEPVEEYRGVFWPYQFGGKQPAAETPTPSPPKAQACQTITKDWTMGIVQPINYRFQVGDRVQALGRPQQTSSGLLLTEARFKFVGRGQSVLYAALPDRTPL